MNSDIEDPDNHVPEVSPEDGWDDLDIPAKSSIPQRRVDQRLPPTKRESKALNAKRLPLVVKVEVEKEKEKEKDVEEVEQIADLPSEPVNKSAKKSKKRAEKKSVPETPKKISRRVIQDTEPSTLESLQEIEEKDDIPKGEIPERIVLPPVQVGKRHRVHEIGVGETSQTNHVQIVSKMVPQGARSSGRILEESDDEAAMRRRRSGRGEGGDWGVRKGQSSNRWMAYTGGLILLLVVLTVFLSQTLGRKSERKSGKSGFGQLEAVKDEEAETKEDPEMVEMLTESQEESKDIYSKYAKARDLKDLTSLIYHETEVMTILEKNWSPLGTREAWKPGDDTLWTVMDKDGQRYGVLEGIGDDFTGFQAVFRKTEDGLKMDWKATTGYSTASMDELKNGKGDAHEMRVSISGADFYTFSLPEDKFRSFRLVGIGDQASLWGYTLIGSELDEKLLKLFVPSEITGDSQSEVRVTLALEPGPEDALPNQWMIKDIIRLSWLDE